MPFDVGNRVESATNPNFGVSGKVLDVNPGNGKILVQWDNLHRNWNDPDTLKLSANQHAHWMHRPIR
jgi:hypothetical protein